MTMTPWLLEGKVQILSISNFSKIAHLRSKAFEDKRQFENTHAEFHSKNNKDLSGNQFSILC